MRRYNSESDLKLFLALVVGWGQCTLGLLVLAHHVRDDRTLGPRPTLLHQQEAVCCRLLQQALQQSNICLILWESFLASGAWKIFYHTTAKYPLNRNGLKVSFPTKQRRSFSFRVTSLQFQGIIFIRITIERSHVEGIFPPYLRYQFSYQRLGSTVPEWSLRIRGVEVLNSDKV